MSGARPGLRERRLSRVHFDGDETPAVEQLSLETPQPLAIHARDQDYGKQEYFDAPVQQQLSPARAAETSDENSRGRPSNAGPSPIRSNMVQDIMLNQSGRMQQQSVAPLEDISPRSTGFSAAPPHQTNSPVYAPPPHGPPLQAIPQWQASPRGPPAAHVRNSPQLPSEPYRGVALYHTPRTGSGEWVDPERERRASAPVGDYGPRARAATYSKGGRFSADSGRNAQAPPVPDNYTAFPNKRFDQPQQQQQPTQGYLPPQQHPSMYAQDGAQGGYPAHQEYAMYAFPPQGPLPPYQPPVQQQRQPALKPALRRTQTEEEARRTTRNAVDIVHSHTQGLRQRRPGGGEDDELAMEKSRNAGVLSNLLQLYGTSTVPRRSNSSESKWDGESNVMSRAASAESHVQAPGRRGMQRMESNASMATTLYEEDLDPHDPRIREKGPFDNEKAAPPGSRTRRYSYSGGDDAASIRSKRSFKDLIRRRRSFALDEDAVYGDLTGKKGNIPVNSQTRKRRLSITKHVAGEFELTLLACALLMKVLCRYSPEA